MFRVKTIAPDVEAWALAGRAARNDRSAQRELFRRLASPLHATLYLILGSNDPMEALLEDAFVEIFRALPAYDRKLDLDTWARAIAIRLVCQHLRNERCDSRSSARRAHGAEKDTGLPEPDGPGAVGLGQFYVLLRGLEPEQHVTLALSRLGRRPESEIAALTGVDVAVVRERILLARNVLRARTAAVACGEQDT
jgi:RNA polymerase sigma-70 factor (ECF subfamily)